MKKIIILIAVVVGITSCTTVRETASTSKIKSNVVAGVSADLKVVGEKITYTYKPTPAVRRGGYQNCINAAVSGALIKHGNADVLVECQNAVVEKQSFWAALFGLHSSKVKSVTVTGYPAVYTNFRTMDVDNAIKAASIETPAVKQSTSVLGIFGR